jgi:DNA primase
VGRTWFKSDRAYSYPKGMNRGDVLYRGAQLWEHTDEPLIVVEGVFDALYMWPHGVALLGKASEYQMEALFESPRPVVIILDGDAWEEAYAMKLRLQLHGKKHVGHVRLPPKKDPDDMPRDWLAEEIRRAL